MNQQPGLKSAFKKIDSHHSFRDGIWICWENLTLSEKVVCAYITLIPL
ncbi:MAG: hypothetical protein AAF915_30450 [Cyanobacteria bacterium P01_D01_bin.50]